jgi:hypothetical protein
MGYSAEQKAIAIALLQAHNGITQEARDAINAALGRVVSTSTLHSWMPNDIKAEIEKRKRESRKIKKATEIPEEPKISIRASRTVTPQHIQRANEALDNVFEEVARRYLDHSVKPDVIDEVKGKDAVIAAATAVDKMRLLRGLPTEIIEILPVIERLHTALIESGKSPADVFERMIQRLHENQQVTHVSDDSE